jgi:hypothetical protein
VDDAGLLRGAPLNHPSLLGSIFILSCLGGIKTHRTLPYSALAQVESSLHQARLFGRGELTTIEPASRPSNAVAPTTHRRHQAFL